MLEILFILAITVESMSGAITAGKKNMDPFGILIIANSTAFGGGVVRDVTLGNYPLIWVANPNFIILTSAAALLIIIIRPWIHCLSKVFLTLDAIGLITFSIIGALKTLQLGHGYILASIMAVFTGAFGGIIRDIFCGQVPLVFKNELYASIAFFSAWLYIVLCWTPMSHMFCIITTLLIGFSIRITAIQLKLGLPKYNFDHQTNKHRSVKQDGDQAT
ncbi:MAG: trimeric intracellular cation channel family protein [Candidatus Endonucleobacter bathymodioli]|uniref:Trimeric intracellular cation channel family protein n=1 Tax=Candidatus Endonucleibacter bathymodioli TaxID=539814 RepID=A0AA90NWY3_9GAMM|nr:trimeric intracellular cation channel family protein [Candidatus Endonucleobacter bathymodioli]